MFAKNSARLLIAACCAALLVVLGVYKFKPRENLTATPLRSARPMQPAAAHLTAIPEAIPTETPDAKAQESKPSGDESAGFSAIHAFRQWAEASATSGFADADETKGMELAKARAATMKSLIQCDPAAALRQALPTDLRASLPQKISAAIEQTVEKTGMCSLRMMCNHSADASHGNCESTPVLLEDVDSWNAYYGEQPWKPYLGQTVGFNGIAVDEELAVKSIVPISPK